MQMGLFSALLSLLSIDPFEYYTVTPTNMLLSDLYLRSV